MNIILGQENIQDLDSKYTVLELDTFKLSNRDEPLISYCVVETIPVEEMFDIENYLDLHRNLIIQYKERNWKYCEDAIEYLMGRWNKELDTFYQDLQSRVEKFKDQDPGPDWQGYIHKVID